MGSQTSITKKLRLWLVEPAASIESEFLRTRARSISSILLMLLIVDLVGTLVPQAPQQFVQPLVIPLVLSYTLSRTRYYTAGAFIAILVLSTPTFIQIATGPDYSLDRIVTASVW